MNQIDAHTLHVSSLCSGRGCGARDRRWTWRSSPLACLAAHNGQPTHPHQEGTNAFSRIPGDPISIYFTRCTLKPMLSVIPRSPRLGCGEHAACGSVAGWGRNYLRQDQNCYGISVHSVDLQGMEKTELINTALFTNCSLQKHTIPPTSAPTSHYAGQTPKIRRTSSPKFRLGMDQASLTWTGITPDQSCINLRSFDSKLLE